MFSKMLLRACTCFFLAQQHLKFAHQQVFYTSQSGLLPMRNAFFEQLRFSFLTTNRRYENKKTKMSKTTGKTTKHSIAGLAFCVELELRVSLGEIIILDGSREKLEYGIEDIDAACRCSVDTTIRILLLSGSTSRTHRQQTSSIRG